MSLETTLIGKGLGGLAAPAIDAARRQWARRGAETAGPPDMASIGRELEEALDTLVGDAGSIIEAAALAAKSALSGRPEIFREEPIREWLRMPETRALLKEATLSLITGEALEPQQQTAEASYARVTGDYDWYGGVVFGQALNFLALTVDQFLPSHARLGIQVVNRRADRIETAVETLGEHLAQQPDLVTAAVREELGAYVPEDVLGRHVTEEIAVERRGRAIEDAGRLGRVLALAQRCHTGDLRRAPAPPRIEAYRLAAHLLARADRIVEAEDWLGAAEALGAQDLRADRARLALQRKDWSAAAELLERRQDRTSTSLSLELIDGRDGRDAALRYQRRYAPAAALSGFMLPFVAHWLAEASQWAEAESLLMAADEDHLAENPTLLFLRARLRIAMMTPADQRGSMHQEAGSLPQPRAFRDDEEGVRLRAAAIADLEQAEQLVRPLRSPDFMNTIEANLLYLAVGSEDEARRRAAMERLLSKISSEETVLDYAWLALANDVEFDDTHLRAQLDRAAMLGGWSNSQLMTAVHLAMRDEEGDEILRLVEAHREQMENSLQPELAFGLEVEVLARRGRIAEAKQRLDAVADPLGPELAGRLRTIIEEQEGSNPVAARLAAFERSGKEADLAFLVQALADAADDRVADYAMHLWRLRHRTEDAVLACSGLFNAGRDADLDSFLDELGDLVERSPRLLEHRAWSRYRSGALDEARRLTDRLRAEDPDRATLRQLAINISIEGGDWGLLAPLVDEDFQRRGSRDAAALMQAAGIAHAIGSPLAEELARAAVAKDPDNPGLLLQAFGLALRRGRDWGTEAGEWLRRAADLSDEGGPIRRGDVRDLIAVREESLQRSQELDRMVLSGEVPLSLAARPLGTTISELFLGRLARNPEQPARTRLCIPVSAGNRPPTSFAGAERIGIDPAALLTLQLCGLLPDVVSALPGLVIPAGTLPLLLHDLEQANRTQTSRVQQGRRIKELVDTHRITVFDPAGDREDDIAVLHAHAVALGGRLVHTSPMHEPGSFAERVRDPAPFAARLSSPAAMVAALGRRGEIAPEQEREALEKLQGYGGGWPDEPAVDLNQPFVLHSLALNALEHAQMLEPLLASGARLHMSRRALDFIDADLEQHRRGTELERAIGEVRETLALALSTGQASMGPFRRIPARNDDPDDQRDLETAPLLSLLQDGASVDVLVSGDRMVNGHLHFTDHSGTARPVATPFDLIDHLVQLGAITPERRMAARQRLREAGTALVNLDADEILEAAAAGDWKHGAGRALRAIRDSLHLPLLRGAVQLPADRPWLEAASVSIASAIRKSWRRLPSSEAAEEASDFLFEMLPDLRAWAERDPSADAAAWATGTTATVHALLAFAIDVPRPRLDAYRAWHSRTVETRLLGRDRHAFATLIDRMRVHLVSQGPAVLDDGVEVEGVAVRRFLAGSLPQPLLDRLTDHPDVRQALGHDPDALSLNGRQVRPEALVAFFRAALDGSPSDLTDGDGLILVTEARADEDGSVHARIGDSAGRFVEAGLFAAEPDRRHRALDALLSRHTLSPSRAERWRAMIAGSPLPHDLLRPLRADLEATPEAFTTRIARAGEIRFEQLVETDPAYWDNLLDLEQCEVALPDLLARLARGRASSSIAAVLATAPLAVSSDLPLAALIADRSDEEVAVLARAMAAAGDPFGSLAGFEIAAMRASSETCREAATEILEQLVGPAGGLDHAIELFCAGAAITIGMFDSKGILAEAPPPVRRCAALGHAGHVCRSLLRVRAEEEGLFDNVIAWARPRWTIAALLDRFEAPGWVRDWIRPELIRPYFLRRLAQAAALAEPDTAPPRWRELVETMAARLLEEGLDAGVTMPGPLDVFGDGGFELEGGGDLTAAIGSSAPHDVEGILLLFLWGHRPPADTEGLEDAIAAAVSGATDEERDPLLGAALAVAGRWRLHRLSDRLLDLVHEADGHMGFGPVRLAEFALAGAAAFPPEQQAEAVERNLRRVVFGPVEPADLRALAELIDLTTDLRPDWSARLEPLRTASMLGA